jgi:hypothetical protein
MAALTGARSTARQLSSEAPLISGVSVPVKAATTIFQGSIVMINAGFAQPAAVATGLLIVGMAEETVVNAGANGALNVRVRRGVFKWANADFVAADLYTTAYANDDQTVSKVLTGKSAVGKVVQIDSDGVWVEAY